MCLGQDLAGPTFTNLAGYPSRVGLTIQGLHTNVRWGPYSRMRSHDFLFRDAVFFSQIVDDLFLVVVVMFYTACSNVVKIWQLIEGPLAMGSPLPWYNRHNG